MKSYKSIENLESGSTEKQDNCDHRELGDELYKPFVNEKSAVHISFANLSVSTKKSPEKVILNGITGTIPGGFCAIMGGSGSGKTTFVSALSLRTDQYRMNVSGSFHINGKPYDRKTLKLMSSYVMQDDLIDPNFSVHEVLSYMSQLRMSRQSTRNEMNERVIFVMKLMGIYHRRDVIVGDTRNKGISGGERKRLSVAIELLSKPSLLFLDEPTSGLDASTALSLMQTLHEIANLEHCTVICTIHQPQPKIFKLFDNLILMKDGNIVYQGDCSQCVPFFQNLGFKFDESSNPADQVIEFVKGFAPTISHDDQSAVDSQENNLTTAPRSNSITSSSQAAVRNRNSSITSIDLNIFVEKPPVTSHSSDELSVMEASQFLKELNDIKNNSNRSNNGANGDIEEDLLPESPLPDLPDLEAKNESFSLILQGKVKPTPNLSLGIEKPPLVLIEKPIWISQFLVLLKRSLHSNIKRYDIIFLNLSVTIILAFFISSSVWHNIGTHKDSASKRLASLFFCSVNQGIVAALQGTHTFPLDRALMLRDRSAGAYHVSAYFLAKTVADMIIQVISPIIFSCIVYPRIGYQPSSQQFIIFIGVMILDSYAATSLSNMASCLFVGIEMTTAVLAACFEISRLYGGWFMSPAQLKDYPDWKFADAMSYIKYAFVAVSLNENSTILLTCLPNQLNSSGKCVISPLNVPPYSGEAFNKFYGYSQYTIKFCVGMLAVYIVVCRIISYLALRYIKV